MNDKYDIIIKTNPKYFKAAVKGDKTFTIRKNDKPYKVGSIVRKLDWMPDLHETGEHVDFKITYILTHNDFPDGIKKGYCVCAIKPINEIKKDQRIAELEAKIKQVAEEFNNQHELLDQYELDCSDEIIRLKNQKIAELEEEIKKYKKLLADKTHQFDSVRQRYHLLNRLQAKYDDKHKLHLSEMQCLELVEQNEKLQEENAKLKEQLKNAIVPKFKQFQKVWYISLTNNICEFEIEEIQWVKCIDGREMITYSNSELGELYEHDLFPTEAEAQKYLEEHK